MDSTHKEIGEVAVSKVVAAVIFSDDRKSVLVGKRVPNKPFPNKWEFIGGKVEVGENLADAMRREALEETNLLVLPLAPLGEMTFKSGEESFDVTFFECEIKLGDVGDLAAGREHSKLDWVAMKDLGKLDWV